MALYVGITSICIIAFVAVAPIGYQLITHLDYKLKSHRYRVKSDIEFLSNQVDIYYKQKGTLPKSLYELELPPGQKIVEPWAIKKLPKDPWGRIYRYTVEVANGAVSYKIWTYGNDDKAGGDGENADLSNQTDWKTKL